MATTFPSLVRPTPWRPASSVPRSHIAATAMYPERHILPIVIRHRLTVIMTAVVVVALIGGTAARPPEDFIGTGRQAGGPAIVVDASPSPADSGAMTLFEITLPASAIPPMGRAAAALRSMTVEPNSKGVWYGNACCPGVMVIYIIDGTYTVQPERGSITVYRAGMTADPEVVDAGASVELGAGDLLLTAKDPFLTLSNPAATPVTLLTWQLETGNYRSDPTRLSLPDGWTGDDQNDDWVFDLSLPAEDATLRLERVTITGTEVMPAAIGSLVQVVEVDFHGNPRHMQLFDGSVAGIGEDSVSLNVLSLLPASAPGTPAA